MLFNSPIFIVFFTVVFLAYWSLNHRWQNRMLLVASYIFYGSWDYRFLSLILASTILDYFCGLGIDRSSDTGRRRQYLVLSLFGNLGILGLFKYSGFFVKEAVQLLSSLGFQANVPTLAIILPVGISFYTFQTLSYTIDVYRGDLRATRQFMDFALFVAFFPQLVAGPIERAANLLPQIAGERRFDYARAVDGAVLAAWGMFKKVVIADRLAIIVNTVYGDAFSYNGIPLVIATAAFAFQILCDFSGYSDIARGVSRMLGFDIMINFRRPYASENPSDFWRRWHISLSSWLRDYLYIPLGGNRHGTIRTGFNAMATMLLAGLWHGADWTFVAFGAYWGVALLVYNVYRHAVRHAPDSVMTGHGGGAGRLARVVAMFGVVCGGWVLFRAESLLQALYVFRNSINFNGNLALIRSLGDPLRCKEVFGLTAPEMVFALFSVVLLEVVHAVHDSLDDHKKTFRALPPLARWAVYVSLSVATVLLGRFNLTEFIYFQF